MWEIREKIITNYALKTMAEVRHELEQAIPYIDPIRIWSNSSSHCFTSPSHSDLELVLRAAFAQYGQKVDHLLGASSLLINPLRGGGRQTL
jgi:hypothetical protein